MKEVDSECGWWGQNDPRGLHGAVVTSSSVSAAMGLSSPPPQGQHHPLVPRGVLMSPPRPPIGTPQTRRSPTEGLISPSNGATVALSSPMPPTAGPVSPYCPLCHPPVPSIAAVTLTLTLCPHHSQPLHLPPTGSADPTGDEERDRCPTADGSPLSPRAR